jgi:putative endonuclease
MLQANKRGLRNQIGALGEQIAVQHLSHCGYAVLARNYLKKWGEIDIVAHGTDAKVHFVEVKTVSYETKAYLVEAVRRGTWRPEEQVHQRKIKRIQRSIESWLIEHNYVGEWQIDIASVRVVPREKYASISMLWNVIP